MLYFFNSFLVNLPASSTLSLNWNLGSFLGIILFSQVFSGVLLSVYYSNDVVFSFDSVQFIMYEVFFGWLLRLIHFNGASLFFVFLFLHFFKGMFFFSYRLKSTWFFGVVIFILVMAESFLGYAMVWAQMSFWATVVITSLFSVIPFYGFKLVFWLWGGFFVSGLTLKFFFVFHFLLPWFLLVVVVMHLGCLHDTGSTSKLYVHFLVSKLAFYPFFWLKDILNFVFYGFFFIFLFFFPFLVGDSEMFLSADYMASPVHIVPEWYFLFAYAILRSIPNKVTGVLMLLFSLLSFLFFVLFSNFNSLFDLFNKQFCFFFFFSSVFLSWLGQCAVEFPFVSLSFLFTCLYFFLIFLLIVNFNMTAFFI